MKFRVNPNKFDCYGKNRSEKIENSIDNAIRKFYRSSVPQTKAQALVEEIEGYFARNKKFKSEMCEFSEYIKHWTEAHRGVIEDQYLDRIEVEFGKVQGSLHIRRGQTSWEPQKDFMDTPLPERVYNGPKV